MQQVENIKDIFAEYFSVTRPPDRIVELGTAWGNFTRIIYDLRESIDYNFDFITIDRYKIIENVPVKMIFCWMSIFDNIDFIGNLIKENTLVLCDNGDKPKEVRLLAPYLKKIVLLWLMIIRRIIGVLMRLNMKILKIWDLNYIIRIL